MARGILHNSDYDSVEAAKDAIDRYYAERKRILSGREQGTRFGDKSGSKMNFTRVIIAKIPFIVGERASSPPAVSVVLSCLHFHSEIVELDTPASPHRPLPAWILFGR